ncbi:MAG: cytochrome P450, partial [Actinomycetota bacterium]|nr:cytochrome P450 [Actinomycetota bacterium]
MEQATLPRPHPSSRDSLPPGPKAPALAQALRYARDPLGFLATHQRSHGDIFTIRFPFFGRVVYVARPDLVKAVFTGSPSVFHAGEANATVLEPALGPNSVLTLDDAPHMRQRKLLLPPFHGERIQRYGELIVEMTRREMESWPVGEPFALRPHTQRITLAVIMRAVFGVHDEARLVRFERLIDDFAHRVGVITSFPILRRNLGPGSPWPRFVRSREALDEFIYEEIKLRRAEPGYEERDDVLSLLLGARDEDGEPMSDQELRDELVTVLGAGHETTATGLAWAVEMLGHNPAALAKLRDSLAAGEEDYLAAT